MAAKKKEEVKKEAKKVEKPEVKPEDFEDQTEFLKAKREAEKKKKV